ncbi:MAG: hypothetical protein N4J56_006953 [Chroococcidiopsis sp. SAG 2025]|uniref:SDR family oxidoreductase n=1 Tax=Chroococcidiopsis sp. SAG 2025 TaxID=171389 RepID=UPI0026D9B00E|nr:SDR family oxidoreductase [Chroococcidiopsis sp. SAG 2025]MDV2997248.1 hypothetical protein [Chroococcidiopsis sp. SAG 2025]
MNNILPHNSRGPSATRLNYVYPYEALKPSNVLATQEIFHLASLDKIKGVHHISTIAVFESSLYLVYIWEK